MYRIRVEPRRKKTEKHKVHTIIKLRPFSVELVSTKVFVCVKMGGCVSISVPCDQTLSQVGRCLSQKASYIRNLQENVGTLQTATQELKDLRDDLLTRVTLEEEKGQ
ncbi:unnamed protein product [Brassica rapa subsp. trilocularis]